VYGYRFLEGAMDHRKQAMILDGAADLYSLIREVLGMSSSDQRVTLLDQATERYLKDVLELPDRDRLALRLVASASASANKRAG
jgi:hypothetical protein